ncbi:MAG: ABC transporter ATP-binding protein [candidate division WOR-3 bacterium]
MLEVENVSKSFGKVQALKNVSLSVKRGEILGIIGPNGAGKTTLFNVISGFYKPDKGKIFFEEKDITNLPAHKISAMGLLRTFQRGGYLGNLTVLENIMLAAAMSARDMREAERKSIEALKEWGLIEKKDFLADDLTFMERRLLDLIRVTIAEPKLVLIDEIVAGLKPVEIEYVLSHLKRLHDKYVTLIIVEHVVKSLVKICNRIIVLNQGEKIAEGTPLEITQNENVIRIYLGESRLA